MAAAAQVELEERHFQKLPAQHEELLPRAVLDVPLAPERVRRARVVVVKHERVPRQSRERRGRRRGSPDARPLPTRTADLKRRGRSRCVLFGSSLVGSLASRLWWLASGPRPGRPPPPSHRDPTPRPGASSGAAVVVGPAAWLSCYGRRTRSAADLEDRRRRALPSLRHRRPTPPPTINAQPGPARTVLRGALHAGGGAG